MVYLIILLMTFLGSVASVFFKKASSNSSSFVGLIKTPSLYWGGMFIYYGSLIKCLCASLYRIFKSSSIYVNNLYLDFIVVILFVS